MRLKHLINTITLWILHFCFFPHIILYLISKEKIIIDEDLKVMSEKRNFHRSKSMALVCFLKTNKYYRNIFYNRIGRFQWLCSWYLPKAKDFFPCKQIGGGVNPAHPYSTILNAKSIGKNFSFRQCTTIGNKRD
jgi:serine O-acetyltransferase